MKVALVGNQNSGKTTLFNCLTGSNQKIGNWPGVTIERKEGILVGTKDVEIVDLPGIYSLSPYTSEEEVSRRFVIDEKPDLIINILDATSIERSLYLTTQLLELDADVVIALNMADILESHGISIDLNQLSECLDTSIVQISGQKRTGIDELIQLVISKKYLKNKHIKIYPEDIEQLIGSFSNEMKINNKRFAAVKMIEDDSGYHSFVNNIQEQQIKEIEDTYEMDGEQLIASKRYDFIETIKNKCVSIKKKNKESITDKLDKVFLNKWAAIPIFLIIMALVYFISIGLVGGFTTPLINVLFNGNDLSKGPVIFSILGWNIEANISFVGLGPWLKGLIANAGGSLWAQSLVSNGIVAGVGAVLSFVPQIIVMFFCLSLLETTGYMARIAFFLDRVFHKFGLSGKSLIPFIVGSGCSVPGIMTSKIVEDENERNSTIILTPFVPCSAKLPLIALFASAIIPSQAWLITFVCYVMAVLFVLLFGYLFKKFIFKSEHSSFISELPEYKKPSLRYVGRDVFDKSFAFIKKAGTIILFFSIVIWFLVSFRWNFTFIDNGKIDESMLKGIGDVFAWFFYPMLGGHWSWGASVSAIQGLVAKEQVVGSLTVIANVAEGGSIFKSEMFSFFQNGWYSFAYLTFNLFSAPCIAAISAMSKELNSKKKTFISLIFLIMFAWLISSIIGCIGWMISL